MGATLTWRRGRLLCGYKKGTITCSMTYDGNGLRKTKTTRNTGTFTGTEKEYIYTQGRVVAEFRTRTETASIPVYMYYIYDCTGIAGINYVTIDGAESYYFVKNALGDII